jgi:hypothetical protein
MTQKHKEMNIELSENKLISNEIYEDDPETRQITSSKTSEPVISKAYIIYALLASLLFGMGDFLCGFTSIDFGVEARNLNFIGYFMTFIAFNVYHSFKLKDPSYMKKRLYTMYYD